MRIRRAFRSIFATNFGLLMTFGFVSFLSAQPATSIELSKNETVASNPIYANAGGHRRLTLEEARALAVQQNKMINLTQLHMKETKQHRLGAQADYFPKIGATAADIQYNQALGQVLTGPKGNPVAINVFEQNQIIAAVTAVQPLTPVFKVHQAVKLANADEKIAQVQADKAKQEILFNVDQLYFGLLMAQRQQAGLQMKAQSMSAKNLSASIELQTDLLTVNNQIAELSENLNNLLDLPLDTQLELVEPDPFSPPQVTLDGVLKQAYANNAEIREAQQNVVKAHAASALSKLEYVPDVAAMGGYAYQHIMPVIPSNLAFVGVMATYNISDFGKRERTVAERSLVVKQAEENLNITKNKVQIDVQKKYRSLESARQLFELAHAAQATSRGSKNQAKVGENLVKAEMNYRQAYAQLGSVIGTQ